MTAGEAFDISNGWDLSIKENQDHVRNYVRTRKPLLVIGSPMCTMFSILQNLSEWSQGKAKKLRAAKKHMRFCIEIYEEQLREGRLFLHEHPASATSWEMEEVKQLMLSLIHI